MASTLILSFLAGLIFANGIPGFVKGITGMKYRTPFDKNSSAIVNVVWGWLNFIVAVLVWHIAPTHSHPRVAFIGLMAGVLVTAVSVANVSEKTHAK